MAGRRVPDPGDPRKLPGSSSSISSTILKSCCRASSAAQPHPAARCRETLLRRSARCGDRATRPAGPDHLRGRRPGICAPAGERAGGCRAARDPGGPRAEAVVLGVVAHRDSLLPLLSLRGLLGFRGRRGQGREKVVVARVGGALVGLLADRMRTIFPGAMPELIEPSPPVLAARAGGEPGSPRSTAATAGAGWSPSCRRSSCSGRTSCSGLRGRRRFRPTAPQDANGACGRGAAVPGLPPGRRTSSACRSRRSTRSRACPNRSRACPRRPKFLEGVVNLRGDVLPVVDQRRRFDMPAARGAAAAAAWSSSAPSATAPA